MSAIESTGAERVLVTHGYRDPVVRVLRENGLSADSLTSRWEGETEEDVVHEVGITVVHEIAHHFGIDDDRLHELGYA